MGLFGPNRTTVGLDIGTGFVKLAEVRQGGDRPELRKVEMRPMPPGAMANGEVREPALVVDTMRELVEDAGIAAREVVTALGGQDVFIKKLQLPRMKGADAGPAIRKEAERHVPFDISGVQLDFQILGPPGEESHMEVLLVAARRERVEARVRLLAEAGIGAVLLDVEAFALSNAFAHSYPGTTEDLVAVVDCGHDATSISACACSRSPWRMITACHWTGLPKRSGAMVRFRGSTRRWSRQPTSLPPPLGVQPRS